MTTATTGAPTRAELDGVAVALGVRPTCARPDFCVRQIDAAGARAYPRGALRGATTRRNHLGSRAPSRSAGPAGTAAAAAPARRCISSSSRRRAGNDRPELIPAASVTAAAAVYGPHGAPDSSRRATSRCCSRRVVRAYTLEPHRRAADRPGPNGRVDRRRKSLAAPVNIHDNVRDRYGGTSRATCRDLGLDGSESRRLRCRRP